MSVMAAIDTAVRLQLARDKPAVVWKYSDLMNAAGGLAFDQASMGTFLQDVAARLKVDTPSLSYDWNRSNTAECLQSSVYVLIGRIASDIDRSAGGKKD